MEIRIGDHVKCTDDCYKFDSSHHVCYGEVVAEYFPNYMTPQVIGWLVKRNDGYSAFDDLSGSEKSEYQGLWIALGTVERTQRSEKGYKPDTFVFDLVKRIRDTL